jgi:amino acid transporter
MFNQLFARKSLETLHKEAAGENRLRRILGPINLTALGIGAIIGSGIFVMTGRVAAQDAGPAILLSFVVSGIGCLFAALCYAEFAATTPVAGSAYTYAYATLGELLAWIIGWDLILEYAMACSVVAAAWSNYFNELLFALFAYHIPDNLMNDPFSKSGAFLNLPAVCITAICTIILVIGIRESATTNAILVAIKVGVVLFVIGVGIGYVDPANWTTIPPSKRIYPEEVQVIPNVVEKKIKELVDSGALATEAKDDREQQLLAELKGYNRLERRTAELDAEVQKGRLTAEQRAAELTQLKADLTASSVPAVEEKLTARKLNQAQREMVLKQAKKADAYLPGADDLALVKELRKTVLTEAPNTTTQKWGLLGMLGLNELLASIDESVRSPFMPYGLAGIVFGASLVFFAYIGFDAVSTHSEEAIRPARDVPFAILASLLICTLLYMAVAAVITGMTPYYKIGSEAAISNAITLKGLETGNPLLLGASALISLGALAGMTSVLLISFLSQGRIFLAMARDGLLPPVIFGAVHPRFRTPHISTMITGVAVALVAAFVPILVLEEMVNIGTLMAFVIVCGAVLLLRFQRPDAHRPFKAPLIGVVAPLGILVNLLMMLFLQKETWIRLVVWLGLGLLIYFLYGLRHSTVGRELRGEVPELGTAADTELKHVQVPDGAPSPAPKNPAIQTPPQ